MRINKDEDLEQENERNLYMESQMEWGWNGSNTQSSVAEEILRGLECDRR